MERRYEVNELWEMAITYKKGWRQDFSPVVRGDREPLLRAWTNLTKNAPEHQRDSLIKQIRDAVIKQSIFRKQQSAAGDNLDQPIMMSVFINKRRYEREVVLEGDDDVLDKVVGKCTFEGCSDDVHGPRFKYCSSHL